MSAESEARNALARMQEEVAALEERRAGLDAEVTDLAQRRRTFEDAAAAAEAQVADAQAMVVTLTDEVAQRAERLAGIERSIGAQVGAAPSQAAQAQEAEAQEGRRVETPVQGAVLITRMPEGAAVGQ